VVERANAVKYGLAATVWATNVNTLHTVSHRLHVWSQIHQCSCLQLFNYYSALYAEKNYIKNKNHYA